LQWGDELDRHPDVIVPPSERLFVRVERQTIWGLSEVGASLFTIRPYLIDGVEVRRRPVWRDALIAAIEGMSDASAEYKGLGGDRRRRVIDWLSSPV
jgi:hypothetical protein